MSKREIPEELLQEEKAVKASGVPTAEQETVIRYSRTEPTAIIWTNDTTVITKLDKLYKCIDSTTCGGKVSSKTYECPKKLISFRSKVVTRELTEEQKAEASARMRNLNKKNSD